MRILVASDSHGRDGRIYDMLLAQTEATHLLFLGDGIRDLEEWQGAFPQVTVYAVRGNNDYGCSHVPTVRDVKIGGKRILMVHGHEQRVKYTTDRLIEMASHVGAEIVVYGHTHSAEMTYHDGLYIVNPGSLGYSGTYATLDIVGNGVLMNIVSL